MDKLKMHSPDITQQNINKLLELFPNCKTEKQDDDGELRDGIDFDLLKQELSKNIVEGPKERYQLNWPGKKEALLTANAAIAKTLRPCREESVDFDTTKNLFIEGDNLDALKLLQETYLGKVKMIYIDPPYNTGKDFIYADNFAESTGEYLQGSGQKDEEGNRLVVNTDSHGRFHSDWLSMMYPRLKLARNLLCDDGVMIISCDENEHSNLIKLGDTVFGENNFCGEIVWKNSSKNDQKYISIQHEYFLFFAKNKSFNVGDWTEKKEGLEAIYKAFDGFKKTRGDNWKEIHSDALEWYKQYPPSNPISDNKHYNWMDDGGVYFPADISGPNDGQYVYNLLHPITGKMVKQPSRGWGFPKEKMTELVKDNMVHFGVNETTVPCFKAYLANTETKSLTSLKFVDGRAASKRLKTLFGEKVFTNPKDEFLLKDLFKALNVSNDDIVLDFFAGSGSTAHAIFELNKDTGSSCKSLLVQLPEDLHKRLKTAQGLAKKLTKNAITYLENKGVKQNISEIGKERIRLAGKKIKQESPDAKDLDTGFRVLKIDSSNMNEVHYTPDSVSKGDLFNQVEHIKTDRSSEDLLFQVMLDWGVDLSLPIRKETIEGKEVYFVNDDDLVACFDKGIDEALIKALASKSPLRVVFRDDGFGTGNDNDSVKINAEQIFKQLAPATDIKAI